MKTITTGTRNADRMNAVIEAYEATREERTIDTAKALVEMLGRDEAIKAVATVVNAVSKHDGRISDRARAWAESVEDVATQEELREERIYGVDSWIHSAHVQNLAEAVMRYSKTLEEIIENEQKHRHEGGAFGVDACKEAIRNDAKYEQKSFSELLEDYLEKARTNVFFKQTMVLACYELMQEEEQKEEEAEIEEDFAHMDEEAILDAIEEHFEENESIFNEAIEELNSWNGYLGDDEIFPMEMLNEIICRDDVVELLNMAYFGSDEGNAERSFNPNREYFYFNGYGNLCSTDYKDYSDKLDHHFINAMYENLDNLTWFVADDELTDLFLALARVRGEA